MERNVPVQTYRQPLLMRIVAVLLALALSCTFVNFGALKSAWADDSATLDCDTATPIGDCDGDSVYYAEVPEGTGTFTFADLTPQNADTISIVSVTVNGEAVSIGQPQENAFSYTNSYTGVTQTAPLYTVALPANTRTVDLKFSANCLAYNYKSACNTDDDYLAGSYEDYNTGADVASVPVDFNKDGVADYIQVQTPYDSTWNSDLVFGIAFNVELTASPVNESVSSEELNANLQGVYQDVFKNIENGLSGVGTSDGSADDQHWFAIAAGAINDAQVIDTQKVIAEAEAAAAAPSPTNLSITAIQLAAAGIDPTAVRTSAGSLNLIEKIAGSNAVAEGPVIAQAFALLAYANTDDPDQAGATNSAVNLIDAIAAAQNDDGGFSDWGGIVDNVAMVIPALAAYAANDHVAAAALQRAIYNLISRQNADGGFGDGGSSNANSTAVAVIALCSVGIDPTNVTGGQLVPYSTSEKNALKALLSFATADKTAFSWNGDGMANNLATSQAFLALAAYQGMVNTGAAYNIYLQASDGEAALVVDAPANPVRANGNNMPRTGDAMIPLMLLLLVMALAAGGCAVAESRKRRESEGQ